MKYLYHRVPNHIVGKELVPLNKLKEISQKAYEREIKKYIGREILLKKKIPKLNCLWNDVIHITAIHPSKIKRALKDAGFKEFASSKWFKINPKLLDPKINLPKYYVPFRTKDLDKYNHYNKNSIKYFKDKFKAGEKPLLFYFAPHILYKGKLKIKDLELIKK